jgi:hypothetical protein
MMLSCPALQGRFWTQRNLTVRDRRPEPGKR